MSAAAVDIVGTALDRLGGDGVLGLACSGGGDSLALLLIASDWADRNGRRLHVFTVDHRLRPEAAVEAQEVSRIAAELGWPCDILPWQEARAGAGIQARARKARHRLLANACQTHGIDRLMLAHTRDDQSETVWLRLAAGGSWRSAAAMAETAPSPVWPEGRDLTLIRPCLCIDRADLRQILATAGRRWVDDPSNEDCRYARIRTRGTLCQLGEAGFETARFAALATTLQALIQAERAAAWRAAGTCVGIEAWGGARIDRATWSALTPAIRFCMLDALVMAVSGEEQNPTRSRLEPIDAALCDGRPVSGCGVRLLEERDGAVWMVRDAGAVLGRVDRPVPEPWCETAASSGGRQSTWIFDGRFELANRQRKLDWRLLGEAYQGVSDRAILDPVPGPARSGLLVGERNGEVVEIAGFAAADGSATMRSLLAHRFCRRLLPHPAARWFDEPNAA
ncbi:tRNA lysidine(34) synthetase TilS [Maricaulis maris]|uniref:tRNA(Ile)-lysidine synthase n=1 Tax=Maricaulis maris TaxID=74318 RepID=A0A495CY58_9PROT|nr:tRNA lysidine(34) synthetase TilS [Maricaulis maris]RKQ94187.1 tRNA(Ile)-lysidine synthase [Maricaulis maris]